MEKLLSIIVHYNSENNVGVIHKRRLKPAGLISSDIIELGDADEMLEKARALARDSGVAFGVVHPKKLQALKHMTNPLKSTIT